MTTIYRVQNKLGEGPYFGEVDVSPSQWLDCAFYDSILLRHPSPRVDFTVFSGTSSLDKGFVQLIKDNYQFGFHTLKAADGWFSSTEMARLAAYGFKLVEVEATDVVVSDSGKQCIFRPKWPTVYRVQNSLGQGPYRNENSVSVIGKWLDANRDTRNLHPVPHSDFSVFQDASPWDPTYKEVLKEYRFGFHTLEAAKSWFSPSELGKLSTLGFGLEAIMASEVMVSDSGKQCLFRPMPVL